MSKEKLKKLTTKFQNQKSNHGITLIALIITIVVMLILVAVTLSIALGENGVINIAKESKEKTNIEIEKEQLFDAAMGAYDTEKEEVDFSKLDNNLPQGFTGSNGTYTSESGNKFIVDKDGNVTYIGKDEGITNDNEQDLDLLRSYFLGEIDEATGERIGRNFANLIVSLEVEDPSDWKFKEVESVEIDEENIKVVGIGEGSNSSNIGIILQYNGELYTLSVGAESMNCEDIEKKRIKVGEYVEYDGITWIIIYADDTHGIQMVSNENLEYNGGAFQLGVNENLISNWEELIKEVDINKDLEIDKYEKRAYAYNNAIEILNNACESIVTKNENIIDVRCVGSNPTEKNKEGSKYSSDILASWPTDSDAYVVGAFNEKMKNTDINYEEDYDRITELLNINSFNDGFWLASRTVYEGDTGRIKFCVRSIDSKQTNYLGMETMFRMTNRGPEINDNDVILAAYLRPVVKLNPNIKFESGFGTGDLPYIMK